MKTLLCGYSSCDNAFIIRLSEYESNRVASELITTTLVNIQIISKQLLAVNHLLNHLPLHKTCDTFAGSWISTTQGS